MHVERVLLGVLVVQLMHLLYYMHMHENCSTLRLGDHMHGVSMEATNVICSYPAVRGNRGMPILEVPFAHGLRAPVPCSGMPCVAALALCGTCQTCTY